MGRLEWQREYRKRTGNSATKKYERSKKGKLVRTYRNMLSRSLGLVKSHLYGGKEIMEKEDFYSWSLSDPSFLSLYESWVESGFCNKLSPSIDRINTSKGYVEGNVQWITHSENSRKGGRNA